MNVGRNGYIMFDNESIRNGYVLMIDSQINDEVSIDDLESNFDIGKDDLRNSSNSVDRKLNRKDVYLLYEWNWI